VWLRIKDLVKPVRLGILEPVAIPFGRELRELIHRDVVPAKRREELSQGTIGYAGKNVEAKGVPYAFDPTDRVVGTKEVEECLLVTI